MPRSAAPRKPRSRSVLVVVQNLPVPFDRRVWLECQALRDAGYQVSVICPKGPGDKGYELHEGVHLYKYKPAPEAQGPRGFLLEFVYCWLRTFWLSLRVQRRHGFGILQACNPPDTYWALGLLWRPFGVKFVFDQHDLNPELFISRFGAPVSAGGRLQLRVLYGLERMTYRVAHKVIATNESYKATAVRRGHRRPEDVTVVRSGPDTRRMRPVPGRAELRAGADHLLVYIGIMGPQDNVDVLLHMMRTLVYDRARKDVHLALLGFGDCLAELRQLATDLDLDDYVTFTGRADQAMIADYMSTANLGLCPDLKTPLNDLSTHNKAMEYMAFALPVVSFDLTETRHSCGDSAVYVESGDVETYARVVDELLDDPGRRVQMSQLARERCAALLDWKPQSAAYVSVFDGLSGREATAAPAAGRDGATAAGHRDDERTDERRIAADGAALPLVAGRPVIDLRDPTVLGDFLLTRGIPRDDDPWRRSTDPGAGRTNVSA